jgi:predicted HicB family RNase H-like nuclease
LKTGLPKKNKIDNRQPTSFHGSRGRPRLIDKKFDDELLQTIEEEGNKENCPGNVEFKKKLVAYAQQTAALQNRYKFCENISQKTINNYKNFIALMMSRVRPSLLRESMLNKTPETSFPWPSC